MSQNVYSLQCKSCGAPLEVHGGGHRVKVLTCGYCGSQHDPAKDYAMFAQFSNAYRPDTLLKPGMVGKIKGVEFTVIGIVISTSELRSTTPYIPHSDEYWAEFLLYSPTHGYLWISQEQGHFILTRRSRDLPEVSITSLSTRASFEFGNKTYKFYEKYQAKITYVAGELTWVAKAGDTSLLADGIAAPHGVSYEFRDNEVEYYTNEYLPPATLITDFNLDEDPAQYGQGVHPLKPFASPLLKSLNRTAIPFAILAVIAIIMLESDGKIVYTGKFSPKETTTIPFEVNKTSDLLELDLNYFEGYATKQPSISVSGQEKPLAVASDIKSWTTMHTGFFVDEPGYHTLTIAADATAPASGTATLKSGAKKADLLTNFLLVFLVVIALYPIRAMMYRGQVWSKVSGEEED